MVGIQESAAQRNFREHVCSHHPADAHFAHHSLRNFRKPAGYSQPRFFHCLRSRPAPLREWLHFSEGRWQSGGRPHERFRGRSEPNEYGDSQCNDPHASERATPQPRRSYASPAAHQSTDTHFTLLQLAFRNSGLDGAPEFWRQHAVSQFSSIGTRSYALVFFLFWPFLGRTSLGGVQISYSKKARRKNAASLFASDGIGCALSQMSSPHNPPLPRDAR